ncbi:glucose-1-phosphate cytidylyltransferase [Bacillus wiedmannii]|uniref:Glucose-1-phosphate cytidylyltransferase n=1 Tax=Bacillus wiedmannii TaxID=1890302 RepID=A0A1D3NTN1_9BACI|nr:MULTISPECIES: sugar phosphate nucleotidyltransferase [Bacillus]OAK46355.1 hypothetical protein A6285_18275 [Bacillus wiedmannii]OJD55116.1 hypothetical protein BAU22_27510 [Bacillus sp. 4048]TCD35015.1 glucose-1-phosphate cytidylyltransferase [Bacillus wiedmannii]SCN01349.1 Uncharacterized protein BCINRASA_00799 [Bacillus wiedmannii]SDD95180.1 glucose-1-phosphate cytidylyltransferase [Bacillus wiedmannii]
MKVVIVCGGRGSRMGRETDNKPKAMVQIGDQPMIEHIMNYFSTYGFKDFILCTGYKSEVIEEYFECALKKKKDWNVEIVNTGLDTPTSSRVLQVQNLIGDEFLLTYCDGLTDVNLLDMIKFHKKKGLLCTVLGAHPESQYGIVISENGVVSKFSEKPTMIEVINGGYFVVKRDALKFFDEFSLIEERPMLHLTELRQLAVFDHTGFWISVDTPKDVNRVNTIWKNDGNQNWISKEQSSVTNVL